VILVKVSIRAKLLQAYLTTAQTRHITGEIAVGPKDKRYKQEGFAVQKLHNTPWAQKALTIEDSRFDVFVLDCANTVVESYAVVAGQWTKRDSSVVSYKDSAFQMMKATFLTKRKSRESLSHEDECPF